MKWIGSILFILLVTLGTAQVQPDIDSLKFELHQKEGLAKARVLSDLVDLLKHDSPREALGYARMLKDLLAYGTESDRYNVHQQIARAYFNLGIFDTAKHYHLRCLDLARTLEEPKLIIGTYLNLSEDERHLGHTDLAMDFLLRAKELAEETDDPKHLGSVYNNIGISFENLRKHEEALLYYRKGIQLHHEFGNEEDLQQSLGTAYHNIGTVYLRQNILDSAEYYYQKALNIRRAIDDKRGMVSTLNNVGFLLYQLGDYADSKSIFYEVIDQTKAINDVYGTALAHHNLGDVYRKLDQPDSAIPHLRKALELGRVTGASYVLQETNNLLADIYESTRQYDLALMHFRNATEIKDSIADVRRTRQLNELQTKFDVEQKAKDLEIASQEKEVAELQRNILIGGLVAVLAIGVLMVYSLRMRVQKNKKLVEQSETLRRQQHEVAELKLERNILERERLLKELDIRTRQLTSSSLHLIQNKQLLEEVQDKIGRLSKAVDEDTRSKLNKVSSLMEYSKTLDEEWMQFQEYFDTLHQSFFDNLKEAHEELTPNDLRLCALIRLNFSVKEAASILNISHGSMKTARYRLRKKLGLEEGDDLYTFLLQY